MPAATPSDDNFPKGMAIHANLAVDQSTHAGGAGTTPLGRGPSPMAN